MPRRVERVALGFRPHSGWAHAVVVSGSVAEPRVIDRRRVELVSSELPRQVYHAAEGMPLTRAAALVQRVQSSVDGVTTDTIDTLVAAASEDGKVVAAGVVGQPREVPDLARVLASHALLHLAEGQLYLQALGDAAARRDLSVTYLAPKGAMAAAATELTVDAETLDATLKRCGRSLGPPWQKDHREAVAAALVALALSDPT
jgi:hypothetical protein